MPAGCAFRTHAVGCFFSTLEWKDWQMAGSEETAQLEGLYEEALTQGLKKALAESNLAASVQAGQGELLASLLERACAKAVRRALQAAIDKKDLSGAAGIVNRVMAAAGASADDVLAEPMQVLYAADQKPADPKDEGRYEALNKRRPLHNFTRAVLFAAEKNAPPLIEELRREIETAERVDFLVSFIRFSGWRLLRPALQSFAERGGRLRLATTTYIGATEARAVDEIASLPHAQVCVSYQSQSSRLHAKAYLFHRPHGLSTAYVGSANMSRSALEDGLEWMVKITEAEQPALFERMAAMLDGYLNGNPEFVRYEAGRDRQTLEEALRKAAGKPGIAANDPASFVRIDPYPFQEEILEKLEAARRNRGETRLLVSAATGTGKTMIAAFDYRRWRSERGKKGQSRRLLFLAHRVEILQQARAAFRLVLNDPDFGELCVGGAMPPEDASIFMSVQTLASIGTARFAPCAFDYIVIDEFHHACAPTYQAILSHFQPAALLGLTATPFRGDGQDPLSFFGGRIAAELPLSEAIDRLLLVPFEYWMVTDPVSVEAVKWRGRQGYDAQALAELYLHGKQAAERDAAICGAVVRYASDLSEVKGIGFCATVEHAEHMAALFNAHQIASRTVLGSTPEAERRRAPQDLESGKLRFIFTVDVYNEGVDIPSVNTVLFLRPTDSPVVFLQQLGRGLRKAEGKASLLVLDFVGAANKKFSYEAKLRALMTGGSVSGALAAGSFAPFLPAGCTLQFEKEAMKRVLENVRQHRADEGELAEEAARWLQRCRPGEASLLAFMRHAGISLAQWRRLACRGKEALFFGELLHRAAPDRFEPMPEALRSVASGRLSRLLRLNGVRAIHRLLQCWNAERWDLLSPQEQGDWRMLAASWLDREEAKTAAGQNVLGQTLFEALLHDPWLKRELRWSLEADLDAVDFCSPATPMEDRAPIELGCDYGARAVLAMLGDSKAFDFKEGVKHLGSPDGPQSLDLFFVTIVKDAASFTETTSYDDYAMNPTRFHWQSQSRVGAGSPTAARYRRIGFGPGDPQGHLFVRRDKEVEKNKLAAPFTYLGRVRFLSSRGERPLSIQWELEYPLSARLLAAFSK